MKARVSSTAPCVFCGGELTFINHDPDMPLAENEPPAVLHSLPECKQFHMPGGALEFVKACNLELARRRGVGLT